MSFYDFDHNTNVTTGYVFFLCEPTLLCGYYYAYTRLTYPIHVN